MHLIVYQKALLTRRVINTVTMILATYLKNMKNILIHPDLIIREVFPKFITINQTIMNL